eukprot:CAMPEP_0183769268 /NCGR_PEP_ID=MMETSP0739-20130205/20908_1 /TAXON_ID=385413 /ORGANISM="Thalassiosira miniscula, Strain CCMP1093" /LENGTH=569 /DNA_ID=CAMNT_0026008819 /DNA_START=178 /DNA_END=1887 /DNA_ORIENTATION=+
MSSRKKRLREASATSARSPNGVESDVSATGNSATSKSSAHTKLGSTASTPVQNGAMNNDDKSTWSKSKKKRMKQKLKKEEARKLREASGGGNANNANNSTNNRPNKQSTPSDAGKRGARNVTSPGNQSISSDDGNSNNKKRLRKNPTESPSAKKTQAPTAAKDGSITKVDPLEKNASLKRSSDEDQMLANDSSPKNKKKKKKKKNSNTTEHNMSQNNKDTNNSSTNNAKSNSKNATKPAAQKLKISLPKPSQMSSLQKAFLERLTSSRFRELNEELYTHSSQHSFEHFTKNPELFDQYHVGFRKQVEDWPVNPVDVIYKKILKEYSNEKKKEKGQKGVKGEKGKQVVVADFGCGDAKLAERLVALRVGNDGQTLSQAASKKKKVTNKAQDALCPFKVFSFDLVSGGNPLVTPADMSNVPLPDESVDVGVYSLALMGTNIADFVREAWRVLKFNGVLRVAEVRSRFETAADENKKEGGGGKRAKLNSKLKQSKKPNRKNEDNGADNDSALQPLMLLDEFISLMERCGFQCNNMDRSNKMFLFMDFNKVDGSKGLSEKERFTAKPCIYKRR